MVCFQVIGNDAAVTAAGASGSFELNVAMPVIARNVLESIRLLSTSTTLLAERCVDGITAEIERMRRYAESSPSVVTPLNRHLGYEAVGLDRQEGTRLRRDDPRDRPRGGVRRAWRAHRGPARRRTRPRGDDALVSMTDRDHVHRQYASEDNLETRSSVWHPTLDGREPSCEALHAITEHGPARVLEVGCGTGAFAARLAAALPDADLVAVDQSARFVELTARRGVDARRADVQDLPFDDESFDAVAALWMLYHVSDLHRGLAELRRVLRPEGRLVAVTNGDEHLADLRSEAGGGPVLTHFSSENGEEALLRHFEDVTRTDLETQAVFPDHAAAVAYLHSSQEEIELAPADVRGAAGLRRPHDGLRRPLRAYDAQLTARRAAGRSPGAGSPAGCRASRRG